MMNLSDICIVRKHHSMSGSSAHARMEDWLARPKPDPTVLLVSLSVPVGGNSKQSRAVVEWGRFTSLAKSSAVKTACDASTASNLLETGVLPLIVMSLIVRRH